MFQSISCTTSYQILVAESSSPLGDHQRTHHIVLFVLEDMAVPHVLVAARARADGHGERHGR